MSKMKKLLFFFSYIFTQHAIAMVIRILVFMMLRLIVKVYRWIYMDDMKAVVNVKIVSIIQKESTVINANRNFIDHMENIGMKPMCAHVRISLIIFLYVCVYVYFTNIALKIQFHPL